MSHAMFSFKKTPTCEAIGVSDSSPCEQDSNGLLLGHCPHYQAND
jgi:hypothetical protein